MTAENSDDASQTARQDIASRQVKVFEDFVAAFRKRFPEVGEMVVLIVASWVRDWTEYRYAVDQWVYRPDGKKYPELRVDVALLELSPEEVAHQLLRVLSVALTIASGLQPPSRNGRYYGPGFKEAATQVGLTVSKADGGLNGWSETEMPEKLLKEYEAEIAMLHEGLVAYRLAGDTMHELVQKDGNPADSDPGTAPAEDPPDEPQANKSVEAEASQPSEQQKAGTRRKQHVAKLGEPPKDPPKARNRVEDSNRSVKVGCRCEQPKRVFPLSRDIYKQGPINCGVCRMPFRAVAGKPKATAVPKDDLGSAA